MPKTDLPIQRPEVHIRIKDTRTQDHISMKRFKDTIIIKPEGAASAETLLKYLPLMINSLPNAKTLRMDFSSTDKLDHLSLSAVIVVLRRYSDNFASIQLHGLRDWALNRLRDDGYESVLGTPWLARFGEDWVEMEQGADSLPVGSASQHDRQLGAWPPDQPSAA